MPSPRTRILGITTSWPNTAASVSGRFVGLWSEAIRDGGMDCSILSPPGTWTPSGIHRYTYRDPGRLLNRFGVPDAMSDKPVRTLLAAAPTCTAMTMRAWQLVHRFDLVVTHWLLPCGLVGLAAGRRACTGVHGYAHGGDIALLEAFPRAVRRAVTRKIHRTMAGLTFVNQQLATRFETMMDSPLGPHVTICPMGAYLAAEDNDFKRYLKNLAGERKIVSTVGRLTHIKGLDQIPPAISSRDDIIWLAAGMGPELPTLKNTAKRFRASAHFLGHLAPREVMSLLSVSDLFIQPSRVIGHRTEGAPVAALEALHAGVPCLFSHTGGLIELASKSGAQTFKAEDHKELARQIDLVLAYPSRQSKMIKAHQQFAKAYTWDKLGSDHCELLAESLARFTCGVDEQS